MCAEWSSGAPCLAYCHRWSKAVLPNHTRWFMMGFLREPANEGTRPFRHVMADRRWSLLPPGSPGAVGGARAAGGTDGQCAASDL